MTSTTYAHSLDVASTEVSSERTAAIGGSQIHDIAYTSARTLMVRKETRLLGAGGDAGISRLSTAELSADGSTAVGTIAAVVALDGVGLCEPKRERNYGD